MDCQQNKLFHVGVGMECLYIKKKKSPIPWVLQAYLHAIAVMFLYQSQSH